MIIVGTLMPGQDRNDDDSPAGRGRDTLPRIRSRLAARRLAGALRFGQLRFPAAFLAIEHLNRLARHDRRDGMFINELRVPVTAQQYAEIVERGHDTGEFHAVDEEDGEWILALANRIQEKVLKVLRSFRHFEFSFAVPMRRP